LFAMRHTHTRYTGHATTIQIYLREIKEGSLLSAAEECALAEAIARGIGQPMRFRIEPIELEVQAVITKDAGGRIGWGALGVGASYKSASTQTLKLKLKPIWQTPDGKLVEDPLIADQTTAQMKFGTT